MTNEEAIKQVEELIKKLPKIVDAENERKTKEWTAQLFMRNIPFFIIHKFFRAMDLFSAENNFDEETGLAIMNKLMTRYRMV